MHSQWPLAALSSAVKVIMYAVCQEAEQAGTCNTQHQRKPCPCLGTSHSGLHLCPSQLPSLAGAVACVFCWSQPLSLPGHIIERMSGWSLHVLKVSPQITLHTSSRPVATRSSSYTIDRDTSWSRIGFMQLLVMI